MSDKQQLDYGDIDEADEEALLKSDDEYDTLRLKAKTLGGLAPPIDEEDSLINEAAQLDANDSNTGGMDSEISNIDEDLNKAAANDGDNDDDDDDDDDDMDESDKAMVEYKNALKEIETNKFVYDKYTKLCELAHSTGDLDCIRKAYNMFASVYPLTPELWLKYINVEISVSQSDNEITNVEQLFRRALKDYYSADVAMAFAEFAHKTKNPEQIWNEVLGTYGLQCLKGREFFKKYREFIANQSNLSPSDREAAYIKSFLRELKYPLKDMEESYIEFKVFYEKNKDKLGSYGIDFEIVDADYFKAKDHLQKILPHEEQINSLDVHCYRERADAYTHYMKESDRFLDENIFQTICERMVAECCLNVDCWVNYIDFIDERDEEFGRPDELQELPLFQQDAIDISARALRNCTWSERLYIQRIHLLEKRKKPREEIQEVLESSVTAGFQTAEPAVAIWLEYLTYLRRRTDWEKEDECEILRKNFNLAWTILGQQWGVLADCNCEILQFWGRLEYGPLNDPKRGKELWCTVMESSDNSTKSGLWIEFILMEMRRDLESTRKLFRKALHTEGLDNPSVIASAWERFERCNGTAKSLTSCMKECSKFLKVYNTKFTSSEANANNGPKNSTRAQQPKSGVKRKGQSETNDVAEDKKKAKNDDNQVASQRKSDPPSHAVGFKEHENQEIDLTKDHLRIFLSNLDYSLNEDDIRAGLPELEIVHINLIRAGNGRSRGFAYLELSNEAEIEKALALDNRKLNGRPVYISSVLRDKEKRQKFKYSDGIEPRKLFIKSLPNDVTKEELEEIFGRFGALQDVRLVYHKSGKFKNIAYVEYKEEASAGKAVLGTNQMEIRGHELNVAISAPPPKPNSASTSAAINPVKLLGLHQKRGKGPQEQQKPRMSLIPSVVRKNFTQQQAGNVKASNGAVATAKTNEDFRKLLQK